MKRRFAKNKWISTVLLSLLFLLGGQGVTLFAQPHAGGQQGASHEKQKVEKKELKPAPAAPQKSKEEVPVVEVPTEKQQLIGIKTVTVSVKPFEKVIRTVGRVEYNEKNLATVNTKVEGWIEKLHVNATGIYVKKDEPLADIYSPELWATQQEFINLVRWAKKIEKRNEDSGKAGKAAQGDDPWDLTAMLSRDTEAIIEAAKQRLKLWDITDDQIRQIEVSEKPVRTLTNYSPVSGYVMQKMAVSGMKVMPGEKLFDIADLSTVWVMADIYEFELPFIKVGDMATVQLSYFPGMQFSTKIDYIYPTLQGETRTARARFTLPNEGGRLKPQMFANVELRINLGRKLAVPSDAVINTGLRQIAYVDKGGGNFEPREVITGAQADKLVEIIAGLKPGEKVSSSANFLIDSEAKLKGIEPLPRKKVNSR